MWYLNGKLAAVQIGRDGPSCGGEHVRQRRLELKKPASRTACVCVHLRANECHFSSCIKGM